MTTLLIETSARGGVVALARDGVIVGEAPLDEARRHARDLAAKVKALLQEQSLSPRDVTAVAVSIGPGSYTGLRVGLASAKAFAYATGCNLIAVPTFHAIAERVPDTFPTFDVVADGLQGLVYHQRFENHKPITELKIDSVADWLNSSPIAVTGTGVSIHDAMVPIEVHRIEVSLRVPTADALLKAVSRLKPVSRDELFCLEPLYLRGSSAEEKRKSVDMSSGRP